MKKRKKENEPTDKEKEKILHCEIAEGVTKRYKSMNKKMRVIERKSS